MARSSIVVPGGVRTVCRPGRLPEKSKVATLARHRAGSSAHLSPMGFSVRISLFFRCCVLYSNSSGRTPTCLTFAGRRAAWNSVGTDIAPTMTPRSCMHRRMDVAAALGHGRAAEQRDLLLPPCSNRTCSTTQNYCRRASPPRRATCKWRRCAPPRTHRPTTSAPSPPRRGKPDVVALLPGCMPLHSNVACLTSAFSRCSQFRLRLAGMNPDLGNLPELLRRPTQEARVCDLLRHRLSHVPSSPARLPSARCSLAILPR